MAIVYLITNKINGKQYIGATITKLNERWNRHVCDSLKERDGQSLHSAIRKYGKENFTIEVLEEHPDENHVFNVLESKYITQYKTHGSQGGYNMTNGGDGWLGMKHSEETKEILRQKSTGRIFSEEARAKISAAHKGKISSNRGKPKPKMSLAKRGKYKTDEQKKSLSEGLLRANIHKTPEQKKHMSAKIAETHTLLGPDNIEFTVTNLSKWCKEHNMSQGCLITQGHSKGYKILKTIKKIKIYYIEKEDTKELFQTENLKKFSDEHGLNYHTFYTSYKPESPYHTYYMGYKILKIEVEDREKSYSI